MPVKSITSKKTKTKATKKPVAKNLKRATKVTAKKVVKKVVSKVSKGRANKSFSKIITLNPITKSEREFVSEFSDSHSNVLINDPALAGFNLHQIARVKGWANPDGDFHRLTNTVIQKDYAAGLARKLAAMGSLFEVFTKGISPTK